jgi:hypothetical protein
MRGVLRNWLSKMTLLTVLVAVGVGAWPQVASARPKAGPKPGPFVGTYTVFAPDVGSGPLGTLTLSPDFTGQMNGPGYGAGFVWLRTGRTMEWAMADPSPEPPLVCKEAGQPFPYLCQATMDFLALHSRTGLATQKHPGTLTFVAGNSSTVDHTGWWAVRT